MSPDYDIIAHQYDKLSHWVFGKKQERAKNENIDLIQSGSKILIVGGGTGSILEYISDLKRNNTIDFVDVSEKMISKAKLRSIGDNRVSFYCGSIEDFKLSNYDVIITNFFFDQFEEDKARKILCELKGKLNRDGLFLFSDFLNPTDIRNKIIHSIMKFYFKTVIGLKVKKYPDYENIFRQSGFNILSSKIIGRNIMVQIYKMSN